MNTRIADTFARCKKEGKTALITFTMAGDPYLAASEALLMELPKAGVDIVEFGMPFSDPTADGPSIQQAGFRALTHGITLKAILATVMRFRAAHPATPLILMGYYNPIFIYGEEAFAKDAAVAGVDGVIIVDLPPEEEASCKKALAAQGLALVRLIAPTTQGERLPALLKSAEGFVYTIAVKGITGAKSATSEELGSRIAELKAHTALPIVAGFGIKTPEQAAALKDTCDGVVIGSALVETFHKDGKDAALKFLSQVTASLTD